MLLTLLVPAAAAIPAEAAATVGTSPICIGSMTLTFSTPLTAIPSTPTIMVSGSATCSGVSNISVSWTNVAPVSGLAVSCEEIVALGSGTLTTPSSNPSVIMLGAGPTLAQTWIFLDTSGADLAAVGVFAWTDTTALTNCLTGRGTISSMTVWGALVLVAR